MNPAYDFQGQVALVTGASSGIGLATVQAFAEAGAVEVLADINEDALHTAADELASAGHQSISVTCDVADETQAAAMIEQTVATRGFAAIGFANPLRHLTGDAAYLAALLPTISGPIVLVGHSYGGAVMSNAAAGNEQVQALVFVNGWMPDEGESIQQLLEAEAFADSLVPGAIRPVPFTNPDGGEGVDLYLDRELFPEAFCADVDPETAAVMAATQRPWSGAGAATPSGPAGWRSIPSWYLLGTEDRAIPPAGQRFMAERGNARIEEVAASHASMVSQPEAVTGLILSAVEETSRSRP